MIWGIGYNFKFPPDSIWEMTIEDLDFWSRGCEQINKWMNSK